MALKKDTAEKKNDGEQATTTNTETSTEAKGSGAMTAGAGTGAATGAQLTEPAENSVAPQADAEKTPSLIEKENVTQAELVRHQNAQMQAEDEAKGKTLKKPREMVEVENLKNMAQMQPSTGIWIEPKGTAHLLDDGWLDNQCHAKILKKV